MFNCLLCGLNFNTRQALNAHSLKHKNMSKIKIPVSCVYCQKVLKSEQGLKTHIKRSHPLVAVQKDEGYKFICDYCTRKFKTQHGLLTHTKLIHDKTPVKILTGIRNEDFVICKLCDKRFLVINEKHCTSHNISTKEYLTMFPNIQMRANVVKAKVTASLVKTNMRLYNVPNVYLRQDLALKSRQTLLDRSKPTSIEQAIINLNISNVKFVGNGKIWINCSDKPRVPDFIVEPFQETKKIIETFGEYWHDKWKTGMEKSEHEHYVIAKYKEKDYDCLVIWEREFNNLQNIKDKINNHICKPSETTR